MRYLFFYRLVLDSFPLAALLPSIFLIPSPSCCVYTFFPGNFSSPTTLATFSLTQFGLFLVLPHRCSSMFFLRWFSLFPFKYSLSPFCSPSATRPFVRFRKHDCTDSCCKCTCHDFLVEYVHTRTYVRACKAYTLETFETHTIAEGSWMLGNSMDYAANF